MTLDEQLKQANYDPEKNSVLFLAKVHSPTTERDKDGNLQVVSLTQENPISRWLYEEEIDEYENANEKELKTLAINRAEYLERALDDDGNPIIRVEEGILRIPRRRNEKSKSKFKPNV